MNQNKLAALLLSAGYGTRLKPLTDDWPKCLMPIKRVPLLEYWLHILKTSNVESMLVNTHYKAEKVKEFLERPKFKEIVEVVYEPSLLGTAGTLRNNVDFFRNKTCILIHADNWCYCDFKAFIHYHNYERPENTLMTMMTFETPTPSSCGIVELDQNGVLQAYHEKVSTPPSNLANAAVYIIEPEIINWIVENESVTDFSNEVIPEFMGKIATWKNNGIHKDIGTLEMLRSAQKDTCLSMDTENCDEWYKHFINSEVYKKIESYIY